MTIGNAIEILNREHSPRGDRESFKAYFDARKMAIRSLEAWEKVKEEIESAKYLKYGQKYGATNCLASGLDKALEIIDKHLQEVNNDS